MQVPRDHHFNPVFHLKEWAGADRKLCEMKRVHNKVVARRRHPEGTGYQRDIYKTEGVPEEHQQHLETRFLQHLDSRASNALKRIKANDQSPWDSEKRGAWTEYILSMMFRNPEAVHTVKQHIALMWDAGLKALEATYEVQLRPGDPATFAEYHALTDPAAAEISGTNMIVKIIANDLVGPTIFKMNWSRIDLLASKVSLLLSDRPLDRPLGLADPKGYIAMPIGPQILFLAANDASLARQVAKSNPTEVVKKINKTIVGQAKDFVWGADNTQLEFVKRHMGTTPLRPVVTQAMTREAIAVAQGQLPNSR